ncbi:MAG: PDZ domain-containing protein, partial [Stellaceae bacterium]
ILQDNSRHPAAIVGHDPKTDLALLKSDAPKPLPYVEWGDSGQAKVGDWVMAVGNPFGLGGTVTAGIVSARGRNIGDGPYDKFLQIDAPINRGNSGGPTFNLHGEVIGINTAIFSPSGGSVGIGFAIPSNFARKIVDELKATGHVKRGWLGVSIQSLTPPLAKAFGGNPAKPTGALIDSVEPNSPAAQAGLKQGDVIVAANGKAIETAHDLPRIVALAKLGSPLNLEIRRGGKSMTKAATVAAMPSAAQLAALSGGGEGSSTPKPEAGPLGMRLAALSPDLRDQLHLKKNVKGVVVAALMPGSPAASIGIKPGDVIESVNRQPVTDRADAEAKLKHALGSGTVVLYVDRGGNGEYVALNAG